MNQKNIGNRLRKFRVENGISQKELADMLGISRPLISMYESGNRLPSPSIMRKYSIILNRSVDEIFFK